MCNRTCILRQDDLSWRDAQRDKVRLDDLRRRGGLQREIARLDDLRRRGDSQREIARLDDLGWRRVLRELIILDCAPNMDNLRYVFRTYSD